MTQKSLNLTQDARLLSGKERARLILKDAHEQTYGDGKGFLTDSERTALKRMTDFSVSKEYSYYIDVYMKTPHIMGAITEGYLRFKYYYETLKKAHLFFNQAPAVDLLKDIVSEQIKDDKAKKDALKIIDVLQVIQVSEDGKKVTLKDTLDYIKTNIKKAWTNASLFYSLKRIVDRVENELGFNPFSGKSFNDQYMLYIDEIKHCIDEHNAFIEQIAEDRELEDKDDYLIPEPTYNTDAYEDWTETIFKEKPRDV